MRTLTIALSLVLGGGVAAIADTTDQLELISGSTTVTITDNGAGDINGNKGTISYTNTNLNGWDIRIVTGSSNSPGLSPFGLDLTSLTATCEGKNAQGQLMACATTPLQLWYSDQGFNVKVPALETTYSTTQTGSGSTYQSAYFSSSDTIFGRQSLIGTVGPFTKSSVGSAIGSALSAGTDYSLTLEDVFTANGSGAVSFSADGNATAVPEPTSIMLFGTVLMLVALGIRRKLSKDVA